MSPLAPFDLSKLTVDDLKDGWGFFFTAAGHYLGRYVTTQENGATSLDPAFSYVAQTEISRERGIARAKHIIPIELHASAMRVDVHPSAVVWLNSFDDMDRGDVLEGIKAAETLRSKIRAARTGISLVTSMPPKNVIPKPGSVR